MRIAISGYSGLIGSALESKLQENDHQVIRLTREDLYDTTGTNLQNRLSGCQAIVHLAGAPILQRWTKKNRKRIYESRTITTTNLVNAIEKLHVPDRPSVFISASAVGIYKSGETHTENSLLYDDHFAGRVTIDWERASVSLPEGVRRIIFRFGLVLDKNSQLIRQLWLPYKAGFGGPVGNGKQAFPFIHLSDLTEAIIWALENRKVSGIYNLVAPDKKTNGQFSDLLCREINRPSWLRIPKILVQAFLGHASQLVCESPEVIPERLINEGFKFKYPTLEATIREIVRQKKVK